MISWHKPGQKVVVKRCETCPSTCVRFPDEDRVLTISAVFVVTQGIVFDLVEYPYKLFFAECFRPVYPQIIDQLRKLDAPVPGRVKEDA